MMPRLCLSLAAVILPAAAAAAPPPAVTAAAYDPTGTLVAFGLHGEVRLFDARTGDPAGKLPGQVGRVTAVAFDPAGTRLAVASGEPGQSGVVRVYRRGKDGRPDPAAVVTLAPHKDAVYALAFAPDGKRLAT